MNICYFGHPAHEWSKSSEFFEDMLRKLGNVTIYRPTSIDVDHLLHSAIESDFDLYVFFQFDFLAYAFLYAGKKVLIVPMIDGSANYGSEHWRRLNGACFISFSNSLHSFLKLNGHKSKRMQYWPEPKSEVKEIANYAYYWPRGHHEYISVEKILSALNNYQELQIRVRRVNDSRSELNYSRISSDRLKIVEIKNRKEHLEELSRCRVFIAPRPSEGIGHSFLEAMSFGKPVIGRKYPTMSEYIIPGINGAFFNRNERPLSSGLDFEFLGKKAHFSVIQGREEFIKSIESFENFVLKVGQRFDRVKVSEVHKLLDISSSIMKGFNSPKGRIRTLQNWIRVTNML